MDKKILSVVIANSVIATNAIGSNDFSLPNTDMSNDYLLASINTDKEQSSAAKYQAYKKKRSADEYNQETKVEVEDTSYRPFGFSLSGNIGTSVEYEDRTTREWDGSKKKERIITNELLGVFLHHHDWDLKANYSLKQMNREQRNSGGNDYYENADSYKHLFFLDKPFDLGQGWGVGLAYEGEYITNKIVSPHVNHMKTDSLEQLFKPYATYWSNKYNAGFYTHFEHLRIDYDNNDWGSRDERGYSFLFKPYFNYGQFRFDLEFFYQDKDNKDYNGSGVHTGNERFVEKYIEPSIRYSIVEGGVAYLNLRYTKNETRKEDAETYFKTVIKAKVGYEIDLGESWMLRAEYEYTRDRETSNKAQYRGLEKKMDSHTVYAHALYRF
ncbi:hypothetical protein [Endozoicomonas lisbonensis]|uniref:Opacity protein-like surface antigen n=1 Tax=Endozoicomonas lisbonensis TaxID=3120522 RepID=A0ABV2SHP3_9GAMM